MGESVWHPGEILSRYLLGARAFVCPMSSELKVGALARHLGVSRKHLSNIINAKCPISTEVALRLEEVLGVSAEYWLDRQTDFDLFQKRSTQRDCLARHPEANEIISNGEVRAWLESFRKSPLRRTGRPSVIAAREKRDRERREELIADSIRAGRDPWEAPGGS